MDNILSAGGIIYGILLIVGVFVKTQFTEKLRIDALVVPNPSEKTKPVNLVAGVFFTGYSIYSLVNG